LKQSRVQMLNAHSHSVTVLVFSDDGKMLATYAYGDSKVIVWQVSIELLYSWIFRGNPISEWKASLQSFRGFSVSRI
jgi:WD40 repeat protein